MVLWATPEAVPTTTTSARCGSKANNIHTKYMFLSIIKLPYYLAISLQGISPEELKKVSISQWDNPGAEETSGAVGRRERVWILQFIYLKKVEARSNIDDWLCLPPRISRYSTNNQGAPYHWAECQTIRPTKYCQEQPLQHFVGSPHHPHTNWIRWK